MPDWGFETRQIHSGGMPDPTTGARAVRLYPLPLQHELVRLIPGARPVSVVDSASGQDGFLLETGQVGRLIASALDQ